MRVRKITNLGCCVRGIGLPRRSSIARLMSRSKEPSMQIDQGRSKVPVIVKQSQPSVVPAVHESKRSERLGKSLLSFLPGGVSCTPTQFGGVTCTPTHSGERRHRNISHRADWD